MKKLYLKAISSKLGQLRIICDDDFIIRLMFDNDNLEAETSKLDKTFDGITMCGENKLANDCALELDAYLAGKIQKFTVKPKFFGTVFENKVWQGLLSINYGSTITYSALAADCGVHGARAVGSAVGRNPVPIIVACHRVIRADGGLGGFRGGIKNKQILLSTEGIVLKQ